MARSMGGARGAALLTLAALTAACSGDGPASLRTAPTTTGDAAAAINAEGDAVISNGTIRLGVNRTAYLTVKGQFSANDRTRDSVGLVYLPAAAEGIAVINTGTSFEGWGVAGYYTPTNAGVGEAAANSPNSMTLESFAATDSSAVSVTSIQRPGTGTPLLRVTHDFHPTPASRELYEVAVTFENISGAPLSDVRYTREVYWHLNPASTSYATIQGTAQEPNVIRATDGSSTLNPVSPARGPRTPGAVGDFTDVFNNTHGAHFDLAFGELAAGATKTVYLYYGAAAGEAAAASAVAAVGARTYAFGQSTPGGSPVTFVLAFKGRTNAPPTAAIAGPTSAALGQSLAFSATGSSDPDGDALTYAWDFGDGATATGAEVTHAYSLARSSFDVTLTVTDARGATGTARRTVTIAQANQPPVAVANGPYAQAVGSEVAFSSAGSRDPEDGALTYAWTFGDGATSAEANPRHAFAAAGTYTARLTVTDPAGLTGSAEAQVTIGTTNRAPEAAMQLSPKTVRVGEEVRFDLSASDPDGDALACTLEFGDGASQGPYACVGDQGPQRHAYAAPGLYTARFGARDPGGAAASVTDTVRVPG